jgi:ATP-binding cassette subfamily F protein uup
VVSHDRAFLDNVVTSTLVLEGKGVIGEYVGGYSDWVRQRRAAEAAIAKPAAPVKGAQATKTAPVQKKRRLSLKESNELAALPESVDAKEQARDLLYATLADPDLLRDGAALLRARAELAALETEIRTLTARWEALEQMASGN